MDPPRGLGNAPEAVPEKGPSLSGADLEHRILFLLPLGIHATRLKWLLYYHIGIKSLPKGSLPTPIRPNRAQ